MSARTAILVGLITLVVAGARPATAQPGREPAAEDAGEREPRRADTAGGADSGSDEPAAPSDKEEAPSESEEVQMEAARSQVRLSDEAELARVASLYDAGKYRECVTALEALLDPSGRRPLSDPSAVQQGRVYLAACLIGSGRAQRAAEPLRKAIEANPQMAPPDSLVFPRAVVDLFFRVRESMMSEIRRHEEERRQEARQAAQAQQARNQARRARLRELKYLASQQVIVEKNDRWMAWLPFGVGQFQNGDTALGVTFLASEVALAATAVTSLVVFRNLAAEENELGAGEDDEEPSRRRAEINELNRQWDIALNVSSWGFLAVAAGGIVEANLSFVPEVRRVRVRSLPERLQEPIEPSEESPSGEQDVSVRPYSSPMAGGLQLGIRGSF